MHNIYTEHILPCSHGHYSKNGQMKLALDIHRNIYNKKCVYIYMSVYTFRYLYIVYSQFDRHRHTHIMKNYMVLLYENIITWNVRYQFTIWPEISQKKTLLNYHWSVCIWPKLDLTFFMSISDFIIFAMCVRVCVCGV